MNGWANSATSLQWNLFSNKKKLAIKLQKDMEETWMHTAKLKRLKGYVLMIPIIWHSRKGKTREKVKWSKVARGSGEGGRKGGKEGERGRLIEGAQGIFRVVKLFFMIPQWWIYDILHLSKSIKGTTQRVNSYVNYSLQLTIIHQYWFIIYNKYTTLKQDVNNKRNCVNNRGNCVQQKRGYMRTLSFLQFFCKPKTALKSKVYLKIFLISEQTVLL